VFASPNAEGYSQKEMAAAMERLFADGKIRMDLYGRPGDQRQRMVRVVGENCDEWKTAMNARVAAVPTPDEPSH
jgi:hypothetical protein